MVALPWAELDPRTHAFDVERVRPALEALVAAAAPRFRRKPPREELEAAIGAAIVAEYGPWAAGWRWSPTEPGGGGPARGWCCSRDSVFAASDRTPQDTVERALAALADWRQYLGELDIQFAMLRLELVAFELAKEIELAAARLLAFVGERTGGEDAWYATFAQALIWYLEAAGMSEARAHAAVAETVRGRFESWSTPAPEVGHAVCAELGAVVAGRVAEVPRDALADWCLVRERAVTLRGAAQHGAAPGIDAHARYIAEHDRARDAERAERMAAALLLARDSAERGMALTLDQLAEWQRVVLGATGPVAIRTTDAFGKHGRERYGTAHLDELGGALDGAGDPALPVAVRAARVYLDVCFFHPFADGNARAARLALDHVLTSAALALSVAEPVFALSRGADDPNGLWSLAAVIERALVRR
jgi:hypothetical protein